MIATLTRNSHDQIERSWPQLEDLVTNRAVQQLSLVYLLTLIMNYTFVKRDYVKALETKMKIQAHYSSLPRQVQHGLDTLTMIIYLELLSLKLMQSADSIIFYQQSFVELLDLLIIQIDAYLGKSVLDLNRSFLQEMRNFLFQSILSNQSTL